MILLVPMELVKGRFLSSVSMFVNLLTCYVCSTLLKMIAYGELKVPPRIDYLYVEQEVLADNTPAVDAVLKADKYVIYTLLYVTD